MNESSPKDDVTVVELSAEARLKMELIDAIKQAPDNNARKQKIDIAAQALGKHPRTIKRMLAKVESEGLLVLAETVRTDKGTLRNTTTYWQDFIIKTYKDGNRNGSRISRNQVYQKVKAYAKHKLALKEGEYPSHVTVYKVLEPFIQKKKPRHPGQGVQQFIRTTEEDLEIEYTNHIWQSDHTELDIFLIDTDGEEIGSPWLTLVIDSYSGCITGFHLSFKRPGSHEVALAIRQAVLPKNYGEEYKLKSQWITFGKPAYWVTDRAKEFKSEHMKHISIHLGFKRRLRAYPQAGGLIESVFDKINKELISLLPGYRGKNTQERPKNAQKHACLTFNEFEIRLVRYFIDHYNHHLYPKIKNQTRNQRWQSGLLEGKAAIISERELDICLLKTTRRKVQKYGTIQFENLNYRGNCLLGKEGECIILRYDPRNIVNLLVYEPVNDDKLGKYCGTIKAKDIEKQQLSFDELKHRNSTINKDKNKIDNSPIYSERLDLHEFREQKVKQTRKQRRKVEQKRIESKSNKSKVVELFPRNSTDEQVDIDNNNTTSDIVKTVVVPKNQTSKSEKPIQKPVEIVVDWNQYVEENW